MSTYPEGYEDVPYGDGPGKCASLFCQNEDCRCLCHYPERRWDKPEGDCKAHGKPIVSVESFAGKRVERCEVCLDDAADQKWRALDAEAQAEMEGDHEAQ